MNITDSFSLKGEVALVTGASHGIGFAMASALAKAGAKLAFCCSNENSRLKGIQAYRDEGIDAVGYVCDVTDEKQVQEMVSDIAEKLGTVDILVNNAGIGFAGRTWEVSEDQDEALLRVNDEAVMHMCRMFLPAMLERKSGLIINMASTGAFQPGPYIASYYASKSFVLSYTQALAYETKAYGIRVKAYCPGPVDTAFYAKSQGIRPPVYMSADQAAGYLYKHLGSSRTVLVPGLINKVLRYIPSSIKVPVLAGIKRK